MTTSAPAVSGLTPPTRPALPVTKVGMARATGGLFTAMLVGRVATLFAAIVILRALTVEELGGYSFLTTLQGLAVAFAGLGIPVAYVRLAQARDVDARHLWSTSLFAVVLAAAASALLLLAFGGNIAAFYAAPALGPVITAAAAAVASQTMLALVFARFQATHRQWRLAGLQLGLSLCNAAFVAVLALRMGLRGVAIAWAASALLLLVIAWAIERPPLRAFPHAAPARRLGAVVAPYFATVVVNFVGLFLAKTLATTSTGIRGLSGLVVGEILSQILMFVPAAALVALMPVAAALAEASAGHAARTTERVARWLGLILVPAALVTGFFGAPIVAYLGGKEIPGQLMVALVLCLGTVPLASSAAVGPHLLATHRQSEGIPYNVLWAVTFVALTFFTAPRWGATGYAAAWTAANFVQFYTVAVFARRRLGVVLDWLPTTAALASLVLGAFILEWPGALFLIGTAALTMAATAGLALSRRNDVQQLWNLGISALRRSRHRSILG